MDAATHADPASYGRLAGMASSAMSAGHVDSRFRRARQGVRVPPFVASMNQGQAGDWPLRSFLELGALPGAVPCARLHARQILWEWHLTRQGDSTELVVSELVTNAVQASRAIGQAIPVRLWLLSDTAHLLILVWDASPHPPVRTEISDDAEHGRGLLLVETLSEQWAWHFPATGEGGKYVWARAADGPDDD